jgi:hypothetical protein
VCGRARVFPLKGNTIATLNDLPVWVYMHVRVYRGAPHCFAVCDAPCTCIHTCHCSNARDGADWQVSHASCRLGVPVMTTMHPVTRQLDYMYSTMDILSYDAYEMDGVRTTVCMC